MAMNLLRISSTTLALSPPIDKPKDNFLFLSGVYNQKPIVGKGCTWELGVELC